MRDLTVEAVIKLFETRSELGVKKYGTTLSDNTLTLAQWLKHSLEEQMDNILYTKRALEEIQKDFDPIEYGILYKEYITEYDYFKKKQLYKQLKEINDRFAFDFKEVEPSLIPKERG